MARSKLKRGERAEPHDPLQIRISGPTVLVDSETGYRVGAVCWWDGRLACTVTRFLKHSIEVQMHDTGRFAKLPRGFEDILEPIFRKKEKP